MTRSRPTICARLGQDQIDALSEMATQQGKTLSDLMREVIEKMLEKRKK